MAVNGEIIAIGDEIISGKVLNRNSNFSARSLFHAGYLVTRITSVGDDIEAIKEVLRGAISRSRFVILTGGLGPTPDDITNEAVAVALGLRLVENAALRAVLDSIPRDEYPLTESQKRKLTHLPEGAEVLSPQARTSGYMLRVGECVVFCLPGVPEELEELIRGQVLPR
ncbi:MAG TPA: competence/damage-inducible protein A, partial [Dissulfuribacter thermophilus]|nr:competence/damage-inducible protein A [Dissulfuribacter thermophilus]